MLVNSDVQLSSQALVLSPESTIRIASAIVKEPTHYRQTIAAAKETVAVIREAVENNMLHINMREKEWLNKIERALNELPHDEGLTNKMVDSYGHLFEPASYGL